MNIVAVVGLRWITRSARVGAPSVSLWVLACLVFFIPLALALDRALQPPSRSRAASTPGCAAPSDRCTVSCAAGACGSTIFLLSVAVALCGGQLRARARACGRGARRQPPVLGRVRAGLTLVLHRLNIIGLAAGKWVQNIGSVATWIPPRAPHRLRRRRVCDYLGPRPRSRPPSWCRAMTFWQR